MISLSRSSRLSDRQINSPVTGAGRTSGFPVQLRSTYLSTAVPAGKQALHLDQPRALFARGIDGQHAAELQHVERSEPGLRRGLRRELGAPPLFERAPRLAPARDELFLCRGRRR